MIKWTQTYSLFFNYIFMNYDTTIHNLDTYILNIDLMIVSYYISIIIWSRSNKNVLSFDLWS
jgi:hypothetical protein